MNETTYRKAIEALITRPNTTTPLGEGWVYAINYGQVQKVNNLIYVYVMVQGNRCLAQAYKRGDVGMCALEYRCTVSNLYSAFELAETWLTKYGNGYTNLEQDDYYPFNPNNKIDFNL